MLSNDRTRGRRDVVDVVAFSGAAALEVAADLGTCPTVLAGADHLWTVVASEGGAVTGRLVARTAAGLRILDLDAIDDRVLDRLLAVARTLARGGLMWAIPGDAAAALLRRGWTAVADAPPTLVAPGKVPYSGTC